MDACGRTDGRKGERASETKRVTHRVQRGSALFRDGSTEPEMEAKWSASRVASLLPVSGGWQRRAAAVQPASECSQSECLLSCKQIQQIPGFWRLLAGPRKTREMAFLISADLSNRPAQPVESSSELRETAECQAKARACPLSSQRWALRRAGLRKSKKQSKAKQSEPPTSLGPVHPDVWPTSNASSFYHQTHEVAFDVAPLTFSQQLPTSYGDKGEKYSTYVRPPIMISANRGNADVGPRAGKSVAGPSNPHTRCCCGCYFTLGDLVIR
jgi:hypothetical protein